MKTKETGWIILNTGIPVFPSLRTTRKECIRDFCNHVQIGGWRALQRSGMFNCRKVALSLP